MMKPPKNRQDTPPLSRDGGAPLPTDTPAPSSDTPPDKPAQQQRGDGGGRQYKALHAIRLVDPDGRAQIAQRGDIISAAAVSDQNTLAYFVRAGVLAPLH